MAKKKISPEIKYALWQAYDHRCCYTGQYILNYQNLEIDHIIPLTTLPAVLEAKKIMHLLPHDFKIESALQNLVPCLSRPNSTKGKTPFPEHTERFFIQVATKKMLRVEEERTKFRQELSKSFQTAVIEHKKDQLPIIASEPYEKHRVVSKPNKAHYPNTYVNYDVHVKLNGFLPSVYKENGGCIVQFNDDEAMFQLYHEQILEMIARWKSAGIKTLLSKSPSYNGTKFFVNLFGISIHLVQEAYEQFSVVLDDFLTEYNTQYDNFLSFLHIEDFPMVKEGQYCRLKIADRSEWKMLLAYAQNYDRTNDELLFTQCRLRIICLSRKGNVVKFWLKPATVQDVQEDDFTAPDYEMEILWKLPNEEERDKIPSGEVWTATQTLAWINQTLDQVKAGHLNTSRPNMLRMTREYFRKYYFAL